MGFFRRDQFRAILIGMVIADAVSHGYLTWQLAPCRDLNSSTAPDRRAYNSAIRRDRWCHQIANILSDRPSQSPLTPHSAVTSSVSKPPDPSSAVAEAILSALPSALLDVEQSLFLTPSTEAVANDATVRFYQGMTTVLSANWDRTEAFVRRLETSVAAHQDPALMLVHRVFNDFQMARGDFLLTVGQGLHTSEPGRPVLSSLLSSAWTTGLSIPVGWQHALYNPPPLLSTWLRQRWHISNARAIECWAEDLWSRWIGRYPLDPADLPEADSLAVEPAVIGEEAYY